MSTTAEKTEDIQTFELYRSIPLVAAQVLDPHGVSFYCNRAGDKQPVKLCGEQGSIDEEQLIELKILGIDTLLIRKQDVPRVSNLLLSEIDTLLTEDSIPLESRFALLQIAYAEEIQRLFRKSHLNKFVDLSQELGKKIAALALRGKISIPSLFPYVHHAPLPYAHLTNVAAYAMILAQELEIGSPQDLESIATGCLLHDVGKLFLPGSLLVKKGRLTAQENQEIERIPQLAYECLCDFDQLNFGQLMMAYQQHERVDGTGYPVRFLSENIHPWAKLLAVVDVLDAITTDRADRSARGLRDALIHLANIANTHLEPKMVLCLITNSQSPSATNSGIQLQPR